MIRFLLVLLAATLVWSGAACSAGTASSAEAPRRDRNMISQEEIRTANQPDAYLLVQTLRPQWLTRRGESSLSSPVSIRVYVDDMLFGDVGALRRVPTSTIVSVWFYDGPTATQRWGTGHPAGVIQVRTN